MSISVARARGSHRDLGRAQGEAFGEAIGAALLLYAEAAERAGDDLEAISQRTRPYADAARSRVPHLVEEVEGIAEGAGVAIDEAWALNCIEEVWPSEACVSMVSGHLFMHAEQWYAGHPVGVVMAEPDDGPAFLSPTCVGFLPAVGLSAAGFALGVDSLHTTDDRVGVPRVLVSRSALGASDVEGLIRAACMDGRAGGYAYLIGTLGDSLALETSATREAVLDAVTAHTNHPLSSQLKGVIADPSAGSRARLLRAEELLANAPPTDLSDCARLLADHSSAPQTVCLHEEGPDASGTVFGLACDLATGRMIVSDGPPCEGRWEEFSLKRRHAAEHVVG
jgi:isopenicillin-N N-acyltransferase-like protein